MVIESINLIRFYETKDGGVQMNIGFEEPVIWSKRSIEKNGPLALAIITLSYLYSSLGIKRIVHE